ncbi:hypothetical protein [Xanthomonas fragariae]|uniref:hypothetical protein n=1 Tax=Xanthomonas fragariae TaxID=48664 RepID=UPI0012EAF78D|nr:hypothetical protein [Xanthomonas fragariae]MEA5186052.1 hypothetical protein [Xanthomonas fragariae]
MKQINPLHSTSAHRRRRRLTKSLSLFKSLVGYDHFIGVILELIKQRNTRSFQLIAQCGSSILHGHQ